MWTSPYRLYSNKEKSELMGEHEVVGDEGSVLLCGEWDTIPHEVAQRLGLVDADGATHSPLSIKRRKNREAAKEGEE
jgi:hypothetical protein